MKILEQRLGEIILVLSKLYKLNPVVTILPKCILIVFNNPKKKYRIDYAISYKQIENCVDVQLFIDEIQRETLKIV